MTVALFSAILLALFMLVLLIEAAIIKMNHDDLPCAYRLYAVRDTLIRLNVEGKIARSDPYFDALYENVNMLLRCSREISGPDGWPLAAAIGHHLAHRPQDAVLPAHMPKEVPDALIPVAKDVREALKHLTSNHFGIFIQMDATRRERARIQKVNARKLLEQIPENLCPA
ncbi:MAG TPA: hypothetical protein VK727_09540 [Steroidobacteraceae bacterium]|jgi:hypothetical protein|nr:hypothetical protein [Steroidobacteraceae bacterium]